MRHSRPLEGADVELGTNEDLRRRNPEDAARLRLLAARRRFKLDELGFIVQLRPATEHHLLYKCTPGSHYVTGDICFVYQQITRS